MYIIITGRKTQNRSEPGEILYAGNDGETARAVGLAAFSKGFVRVGIINNPQENPLHPPAVMSEAKPAAPAGPVQPAAEESSDDPASDKSQPKPKSKK